MTTRTDHRSSNAALCSLLSSLRYSRWYARQPKTGSGQPAPAPPVAVPALAVFGIPYAARPRLRRFRRNPAGAAARGKTP
eukprot:scaffold12453_cov106-Isochrysis_galbana.AAC.6